MSRTEVTLADLTVVWSEDSTLEEVYQNPEEKPVLGVTYSARESVVEDSSSENLIIEEDATKLPVLGVTYSVRELVIFSVPPKRPSSGIGVFTGKAIQNQATLKGGSPPPFSGVDLSEDI